MMPAQWISLVQRWSKAVKNQIVVISILLLIALAPSLAKGDAAEDLATGREALQNAKLKKHWK
jgi:hypothetical protein